MNSICALVVVPVVVGAAGCPTRGNARKIGVRVDIRPVASAAPERRVGAQREQDRQVDAHAVGDVDRLVGVVEPDVDVQAEDELLARDEAQRADQVAVARRGATIRWSSHIANGWVPAEPIVEPLRRRPSRGPGGAARAAARRPRPCSAHGSVEISSTDSMSSGLISPVGRVLEQRLDRVDEVERLARRRSSAPPRCRSCSSGPVKWCSIAAASLPGSMRLTTYEPSWPPPN